jgi:hypothetical protein
MSFSVTGLQFLSFGHISGSSILELETKDWKPFYQEPGQVTQEEHLSVNITE